jgi:hypothetical protein
MGPQGATAAPDKLGMAATAVLVAPVGREVQQLPAAKAVLGGMAAQEGRRLSTVVMAAMAAMGAMAGEVVTGAVREGAVMPAMAAMAAMAAGAVTAVTAVMAVVAVIVALPLTRPFLWGAMADKVALAGMAAGVAGAVMAAMAAGVPSTATVVPVPQAERVGLAAVAA